MGVVTFQILFQAEDIYKVWKEIHMQHDGALV